MSGVTRVSELIIQEEDLKRQYFECFKLEASVVELPNSECVGKSALISACFEWNEHHNKQDEESCSIIHASCSSKRMKRAQEEWLSHSKGSFISFTTHDLVFKGAYSTACEGADLKDAVIIMNDSFFLEETSKNFASASVTFCMVENSIKNLEKEDAANVFQQTSKKFENVKTIFRAIRSHRGNEGVPAFSGVEILRWISGARLDDIDKQYLDRCEDPVIRKVDQFIRHIFCFSEEDIISSFRMFQTEECSEGCHTEDCKKSGCRSLIFLCVNPAVVVEKIMSMKPKSIMFAGKTLYPFHIFKEELNIPEARVVESQYFVKDYQIFSTILTCGAGGYYLNSSSERPYDEDYLNSIGKSVLEILKITPQGQGMIVYFSSYSLLDKSKTNWQKYKIKQRTLWELICDYKDIIVENNKDNWKMVQKLKSCQKSKGSCLLTVLRGKITEDLDIDMDTRRVILIVGVPFIPENDPKVEVKYMFNNERTKFDSGNKHHVSGQEYNQREAYKAVNRVIDQQIQKESDYGVVLLCDESYNIDLLSPWIKDKIEIEKRFMEVIEKLTDFFDCTPNRMHPNISSFGNVKGWEHKKIRKTISKLESRNCSLEDQVQDLNAILEKMNEEEVDLTMKLSNIRAKNNETQRTQETLNPDLNQQLAVSPRKRPFPEDMQ